MAKDNEGRSNDGSNIRFTMVNGEEEKKKLDKNIYLIKGIFILYFTPIRCR